MIQKPEIFTVPTLPPESLAFMIGSWMVVPEFVMSAYHGGCFVARYLIRHELFHARSSSRSLPTKIEELLATYYGSKYLPLRHRLKLLIDTFLTVPNERYIKPGINDIIRVFNHIKVEQIWMKEAAEAAKPGLLSTIKNIAGKKGIVGTLPYWEKFKMVRPPREELLAPYEELLRRISFLLGV